MVTLIYEYAFVSVMFMLYYHYSIYFPIYSLFKCKFSVLFHLFFLVPVLSSDGDLLPLRL